MFMFVCLLLFVVVVVVTLIDPKRNPKIRQFRRNNGKIWIKNDSVFANPSSDVGCVTQDVVGE